MFKYRPLEVTEHCQQQPTGRGMWSVFFGRRLVFPLHAPLFGFWFMTMYPSFIPSDDAIQEVITFMVAPLQKTTADVLAIALMPFTQMFGHPPCRTQEFHALKNMLYLQWCRVVTRFLLLLHSLLFGLNNVSALFLLLVSGWCWRLLGALGIHYICQTILEHFYPFI